MSEPTATRKLIQSYYDAFNRGDRQGFLALLTDDVVHDVNQGKSEHGKAAFTKFMDKMDVHYKETITDLVVMVDETGKRASAEFRVKGTYLKTDADLPAAKGQTYDLAVGAFFSVKGGKVQRVTNYYNLQAWLDMVK